MVRMSQVFASCLVGLRRSLASYPACNPEYARKALGLFRFPLIAACIYVVEHFTSLPMQHANTGGNDR